MKIKITPSINILVEDASSIEILNLNWAADLLRGVQEGRSLQSAADTLQVSYRTLWNKLKAIEKSLGCLLLLSVKGHGSTLTDAGVTLLKIVDDVNKEYQATNKSLEQRFQLKLDRLVKIERKKWVICASSDPLLENAIFQSNFFELQTMGSGQSLESLLLGKADLAGFHVPDDESIQGVKERLSKRNIQIYPIMTRTQGLMVQKGNPLRIRLLTDLARPEVRFINRQKGAGTRLLLDKLLDAQQLPSKQIRGYGREEFTHSAVATAILAGTADVGLGLKGVAIEHGLDFISLGQETYYLATGNQLAKQNKIKELMKRIKVSAGKAIGYKDVKLNNIS